MSALTLTDTPSGNRYYVGDVTRITGFSLSQTVRLELLGPHPESRRSHVWGLNWDRAEIIAFAALLDEADYRDWLLSLLGDNPIATPKCGNRVGAN